MRKALGRGGAWAAAVALLASLVAAAAAQAGSIANERPFLFAFNGKGSSAGRFSAPNGIAVDEASGAVYVANNGVPHVEPGGISWSPPGSVCKFHPGGSAWDFTSTGSSCLFGVSPTTGTSCSSASAPCEDPFTNGLRVAVDNSGGEGTDEHKGEEQGRLYVSQVGEKRLSALGADGSYRWSLVPPEPVGDVAVDREGHPWTIESAGGPGAQIWEYANRGAPPPEEASFTLAGESPVERIEFDLADNCYLQRGFGGELQRFGACALGGPASLLDPFATDVDANQSPTEGQTGAVFTTAGPVSELQQVTVAATGGQFRLRFGGETSADIAFDASHEQVQSALRALAAIGASGVSVSGGPGNSGGTTPYLVRFGGPLAEQDVEELSCEDGTTPLSGGSGCSVTTTRPGASLGDVSEYDGSTGALRGAYGSSGEYLSKEGAVLAYDPASDWVYVAQRFEPRPAVAVFGPKASGTTPEATIGPPSEVGISCARFSGTVNPKGVASAWQLEWREAGESWAAAGRSAPESLPVLDESDHPVSYHTCALHGGTTFQVRLVGISEATGLRGFSALETLTTEPAVAPVISECPRFSARGTTSVQIGCKIDPKEDETSWWVETQRNCEGAWSVHTPSEAQGNPIQIEGTPPGPVALSYPLEGLLPSETYCVRVKAENSGGPAESPARAIETKTAPPAEVETAFAAPRLATSARLNARVNPEGAPLTYHFEVSEEGGEWKPLEGCTNEAGEPTAECEERSEAREQIVVAEELTGLAPSTAYSYRFVAENAASRREGAERSFTARSSEEVSLPAPRGYELVNSPDKGDQNVFPNAFAARAPSNTPDGERFLWKVTSGSPGGHLATGDTYLAKRSAGGWRSQTLIPPPEGELGGGAWGYQALTGTPGFGKLVFATGPVDVFLETRALVRVGAEGGGEEALGAGELGALGGEISEDGAHAVFFNPQTKELEDLGRPGEPEAVSVMPDASPSECLEQQNSFTEGISGAGVSYRAGYRRLSEDGSRVYFETRPNGECGATVPLGLYERDREANEGAGQTTLIDPGTGGHSVELIRVTPDGRSAYFTTYSKLDPADTNSDADVYRWDEEAGKSTCLTCAASEDAAVQAGHTVLVSDDFSHVYFESEKQLVAGLGRRGDLNLYALSGGQVRFVADPGATTEYGALEFRRARLSADGNVLVFSGQETAGGEARPRSLTADQVAAECPNLAALGTMSKCYELYRYDDAEGSLECLSCRRAGETTNSFGGIKGPLRGVPGEFELSEDGSTTAFPSAEALVPADVNGGVDIYEWRDGVLRLATDGVSEFGEDPFSSPKVAGLDRSGRDVFFSVAARLTGYEHDGLANLYDARAGGGFPLPQAEAGCEGDSCQGPLQPAPPAPAPGSEGFQGHGNEAGPARCPRGKVRRHGRCRKAHRRHRHRKARSR